MRRYTEKPCPGCGAVAERQSGSLCLECRQLIEIGRERVKEVESMKATGEKILTAVGERFVFFPKHCAGPPSYFRVKDSRDVVRALVDLGQLDDSGKLGKQGACSTNIYFEKTLYRKYPTVRVWATPTQVEAIELILGYMDHMFRWYFSAGYDLGKNLLHRLAIAGTQELNELVIKG